MTAANKEESLDKNIALREHYINFIVTKKFPRTPGNEKLPVPRNRTWDRRNGNGEQETRNKIQERQID